MNIIKLILPFILITINLPAQTSRRIIQLSGSISEKYPVRMTLAINGDKVLGFYYYEKYKSPILLEGSIKGERITLKEAPGYEEEFKVGFTGDLKGSSFSGLWTNKDNFRTLNFTAKIDSDLLTPIEDSVTRIEGTYENVMNSDKFSGYVVLKYITSELFCFEISDATESGCVGYIKGLIKFTDRKKGVYSGDSCEKLELILSPDGLMVSETNCGLHGMRCPFDGKYEKK